MIVLTCSSWKFSLPNVKDSIKIVRHNESDTSCRRLPNAVHTLSCMIRGLICHVYLNSIWVLCVPARKCPDHGAPPKPKAVVEVYSLLVYYSTWVPIYWVLHHYLESNHWIRWYPGYSSKGEHQPSHNLGLIGDVLGAQCSTAMNAMDAQCATLVASVEYENEIETL